MENFKYTILILTATLFSCGNNQSAKEQEVEDNLYKEVMGIHDEVMPKTGILVELEGKLKEVLGTLDSTTADFPERQALYEKGIADLEEAHEAMMGWMRGFKVNQEGWPHDSVMSYLGGEKEKISQVREQILFAISNSEDLLGY